MTINLGDAQSQLMHMWFIIIGLYKRIINIESGPSRVFVDRQMPFTRGTVAVTVMSQCSVHAKNCIRKQADHNADFAEIVMIDPPIIPITNLFHIPLFNQLLQLTIKDLGFLQVL